MYNSDTPNIRDVEMGDKFTLTMESGESLSGVVVDIENHKSYYTTSWTRVVIEGDWWEQVSDRVDTEVLKLYQEYLSSDVPKTPVVRGDEWNGAMYEMVTLGKIQSLEVDN